MKEKKMDSVFSTLFEYFKNAWLGVRSVFGSFYTALPYLLIIRSGDLRKEVTEQYPDPVSSRTPDDLPPRVRGLLFNDIEKCTGCHECIRSCPVRCISIQSEPQPEQGKIWVSVFDIDFSKCTFCGLCVSSCIPGSLIHTRQYEGAVYNKSDLIGSFGRGEITQEQRDKWEKMRNAKNAEELVL